MKLNFTIFTMFSKLKKILDVLCGMWDLSSLTGDQTCAPAVDMWNLNHWNSREVLIVIILKPTLQYIKYIHIVV